MKKGWIGIWVFILACVPLQAQEEFSIPDSLWTIDLSEIIILSKPLLNHHKQPKPLSTLDEYLERSSRVNMIRRGGYAWEPSINNMMMERISVTIDGMHIFGACTDKMDPITSYVDVSNLSEVNISSGQQGAGHGPTIGGSIQLNRSRTDYTRLGWGGAVDLGFESNGLLQTYGAEVNYTHRSFFADVDFMYRDAWNYKAGKNEEVLYSQFTKYNIAAMTGGRWKKYNSIEASLIYDKATDVGYPALPMDVSLARAVITSLRYQRAAISPHIESWETRVYYNTIRHEMDDTKRPDVPIHMDMPGWSRTYGAYSSLQGQKGLHDWKVIASGYHNQSLAEMTMYPSDPDEMLMFMYTWPDVRTQYMGIHAEDRLRWGKGHSVRFSAAAGMHRNMIASDFGLNSLQIFYPGMPDTRSRFIGSASGDYTFKKKSLELTAGAGYGERAPTVSEGYGFYLFNSYDGYDYVGNPELKNERSVNIHGTSGWKNDRLRTSVSTNYFLLLNYIIGIPEEGLSPMTIGAEGIKVYRALPHASMFSVDGHAAYRFHPSWNISASLVYSLGRDNKGQPLPLIRPFSYRTSLDYRFKGLDAEISVEGSSKQRKFSTAYGETKTPAYAIVNFSAGYIVPIEQNRLHFRIGVENLLDKQYSTYADWNNIFRKGRNVFINLSFVLDKKRDDL